MRWWGVGRGYFRNVVAIVLFVVLGGTFLALLWIRDALRPLMIASEKRRVPLQERVFRHSEINPTYPTLGDVVVFAAICDSCLDVLRAEPAQRDTTCERAELLRRRVERRLATELNRYGWSVERFWFYRDIVLATYCDSIPSPRSWIGRCLHPHAERRSNAVLDSALSQAARPLLRGRIWWLQLGFAQPQPPRSDTALPMEGG
ncbi:MAG: hypothetical protein KatS3mg038_3030 [Candidatus Kapaibacterium sp.]|nr:MAG: hypothetical protein KatS3mg038_3030 [Candidatus Kapabacteria bacterium]